MRRGGGPGAPRSILDDADRARIAALFGEGKSRTEIAEAVGCSEINVAHVLLKMGLQQRVRPFKSRHSIREAAARAGLGG